MVWCCMHASFTDKSLHMCSTLSCHKLFYMDAFTVRVLQAFTVRVLQAFNVRVLQSSVSMRISKMLALSCGRDVFLLAKPAIHISDFFVRTPLEFTDAGELQSAWCASGPSHSLSSLCRSRAR